MDALVDTMEAILNINSEIGVLEAVLLHRPGKELEALTPDSLESLLFDDIPWLKAMQTEHDAFADVLRSRGVKVFYVGKMLADILEDEGTKEQFVDELLEASRVRSPNLKESCKAYFMGLSATEAAETAISGLAKPAVCFDHYEDSLWDVVNKEQPFYVNPLTNLYFTRDPAAVIGNGICINSMHSEIRSREPSLIRWIYESHPAFGDMQTPFLYDDSQPNSIEGGDILVLSEKTVAIGCSQRSTTDAIEAVARNLFRNRGSLREILVMQIPPIRAFMHLDTVFTMVDRDKFLIYPGIEDKIKVYSMTRRGAGELAVSARKNLPQTLKESLGLPAIQLIRSGGDAVTAAREQWSDSTNTLAIAPGSVVTYSRNERSNELLRENGIEVLEIDGSELVRGRGGPRCMSCPLRRKEL